ncbi:MAG TPA: GerMN domain-containing protein [Acidimicrobiales bacterium]|nr:GerMN domain-containing protein [Acidimicrobiales bacterium]
MSAPRRLGAPPRPARALVALGALALAALVLTACGIPVDHAPHALARGDVPFGLLEPAAASTSTTTTAPPVGVPVTVYMMGPDGHLVAVSRDVSVPAPMTAVLSALVDGPTATETSAGLSSAVPTQTTVLSAAVTAGIVTVNLVGPFDQLVGQPQIQAVAQFVYTAAAQPGVKGVAFELSGQAVEVPVAGGAQVPVATPDQFAPLAPAQSTPAKAK